MASVDIESETSFLSHLPHWSDGVECSREWAEAADPSTSQQTCSSARSHGTRTPWRPATIALAAGSLTQTVGCSPVERLSVFLHWQVSPAPRCLPSRTSLGGGRSCEAEGRHPRFPSRGGCLGWNMRGAERGTGYLQQCWWLWPVLAGRWSRCAPEIIDDWVD